MLDRLRERNDENYITIHYFYRIVIFHGKKSDCLLRTKSGDLDETGRYLILRKPIDIALLPNVVSNDEPEKNVKLIQLIVFNDPDWEQAKEGNVVHITGTLFHALTGHHHARVLLKVEKIAILSKRKLGKDKLDVTNEDRQYLKGQNLQD